jgi:tripartite-type tricarboxylate transporter receptor subunit TctC
MWKKVGICTKRAEKSRRLSLSSVLSSVLALLAIVMVCPAQAQQTQWPQRSVRFILPFGAGSATDVAARLIGDKLQARWGHPVVIENKPGADGVLAISAFLQANDDHVLLYSSSGSFVAHPYTLDKLTYDFRRDLAPIARVTDTVLSLNVPASSPIKSLEEFVAEARKAPGKMNVTGAPGVPDFTLDYFLKRGDINVTKIPFRNIVEAATALAGGQIDLLLTSVGVVQPLLNAGKIRIIAITNRDRASFAPGLPTVAELGFNDMRLEGIVGLYGPRGMPLEVRERIARDVESVMSDRVIIDRLAATGQVAQPGGPAALAQALDEQAKAVADIAKTLNLKPKR